MNETYQVQIEAIKKHFLEHKTISLENFYTPNEFEILANQVQKLSFNQNKKLMHHSYASSDDLKMITFLLTNRVKEFITEITGQVPGETGEIIAMNHRDFKLRVEHEKSGYLVLFTFNEWPEGCGGDIFVIDNEEEALHLPRTQNTLTIIKVDKGYQEFFSYLNHYAESTRLFYRLLI